jgi:hypothetical protein
VREADRVYGLPAAGRYAVDTGLYLDDLVAALTEKAVPRSMRVVVLGSATRGSLLIAFAYLN